MEKLFRILVPNRNDLLVFIACLIAISSIVAWSGYVQFSHDFVFYFAPLIAAICATLVGIGAVVGWGRFRYKPTAMLFLICLLALGLPCLGAWLYSSGDFINSNRLANRWWWANGIHEQTRWEYLQLIGWTALAAFGSWLAVIVGVVLFRYLPRVFKRLNLQLSSRFKITRPRVLIAVASILFVIAVSNNVIRANGISPSNQSESIWLVLILNLAVSLFVFFAVIVLPSWCLIFTKKKRVKLAVCLLFVAVLLMFALGQRVGFSRSNLPAWLYVLLYPGAGVLFLATIMCLKQDFNSFSSNDRDRRWSVLPSVWSLVPIGTFLSLAFVAAFCDLSLLDGRNSNNGWNSLIQVAKSTRLRFRTGGQIQGAGNQFMCRLGPDSDPNVLALLELDKSPNWIGIQFFDFQPHVKTTLLRKQQRQVSICEGTITTCQLEDVLFRSFGASWLQNVDVDDSLGKAQIETGAALYLHDNRPGKIGRLFRSIESFVIPPRIHIYSKISIEDWPAIVNASQTCQEIVLYEQIPPLIESNYGNESLKNIVIRPFDHNQLSNAKHSDTIRLIRDTDIRVIANSYILDEQFYWDLCFAIPDRMSPGPNTATVNLGFQTPIDQLAKDFHWAYRFDDQGRPTEVFIPGGDQIVEVGKLTTLTSLSFDARWLKCSPVNARLVQSLDHLATLTKLEQLYLSDNLFEIRDLSFLLPMTCLKHLQISAVDRTSQGPIGFDACPSLESITIFGKPDTITIRELQKLPLLEKVTIVDSMNEIDSYDEYRVRLGRLLPAVELVIEDPLKFNPEVPDRFKLHLQETSQRFFAKLLQDQEPNGTKSDSPDE